MDATETYMHWRERVYGPHPSASSIPQDVLRDYLDVQFARREWNRGIDRKLLSLPIPVIKARGRSIFLASQKENNNA